MPQKPSTKVAGKDLEKSKHDTTEGEKQFNGNTHKHEAMVKKSTEGVSKDTPGTHPRSSTQARFNWKKATTLLVSASRFMEGQSDIPDTAGMQTYYPPTRSKHDADTTPKSVPEPPSRPKESETMHLDDIWTPAYYGDEEEFDKEGTKSGKVWILFSTKDDDLKLVKGLQGKSYPINGQYKVEIHGQVYKGNLLSELIKNVREKECDTGEAEERKCASLVYYRDLKRFAGSKKIEPFEKKEHAKTIGKGEFGEVTVRRYREEVNGKTLSMKVAVKRIKQTSRRALVGAMEVAVMCTLLMDSTCDKRHLLPLVGWYVEAEYLYVVTEFMPGGTLLNYLRSLQLGSEEDAEEREMKDHKQCLEFHRFVSEIATGMWVLEAKRIQHRDLAARNILLTQNHQIKIGDFGLSRPDGSQFTFGCIATRWTAPEVLQNEANFTLRSDVWSFGVVMWEIYSLGSLPYSEVPSRELLNHLHSGRRLDPPYETPSRIAKLMNMCWKMPASSRPSFVEIDRYLHGGTMCPDSAKPPLLPAKTQISTTSSPPYSPNAKNTFWTTDE
ncbi:tyrosine protein kinase csk [Echinococcus multilocularis]|uniref:Tyrosine protein kinase csk n=1 Tax=Echinococcus multilocularis TaxID=6211 RepID=A0A068Y853_ECHMU|nr:tyrosine protein kinase csk [Echinococcus multilocularis]